MEQLVREEQDIRNENLRLQRKLQLEVGFFDLKEKDISFHFISRLIVVNNSVVN
jgi:hypothetical protein